MIGAYFKENNSRSEAALAVGADNLSQQTLNSRNETVDLFRLIGAFAVILLHVKYQDLPNSIVLFLRWTGRWAVPFFFMVSGYFFQKNYSKSGDPALLKSLQNLVLIALAANLVYLPFNILQYWGHWSEVFSLKLFTMSGHLWFINSLIIGHLVLWVLIRKKLENWLLPLAVVVLIFSLLTNAYSLLFQLETDHSFAMMVLSLPLLILGYKAAQHHIKEKTTLVIGLVMIFLGFALQTVEILLLFKFSGYSPHNQEFLLGTLLYSLGMFVVAFKARLPKINKLAAYGRNYSLPIYLYHPLVIFGVSFLPALLPAAYRVYLLWLTPLLCIVLTFFLIRFVDKKFPAVFRFISGR